jgi:hypothetical protein
VWLGLVLGGLVGTAPGCTGDKTTIQVTVPATATPADGATGALVSVLVTQGGQPVPDANNGVVEMTVNQGQFGPYDGDTQDDTTQQTDSVNTVLGTAKVDVYSIHPSTSVVTIQYSDDNGTTASTTAAVKFDVAPDAGM